jgi:hypothetical protein
VSQAPSRRWRAATMTGTALIVGVLVGAFAMHFSSCSRTNQTVPQRVAPNEVVNPTSYHHLLAMSPEELAKVELPIVNLLCAKGLPGTEDLDVPAALVKLGEWATKVKSETERHLYRATDPKYAEHYAHSEARLRAEFIVQCLQEDCGVHYNMERVRQVDFSKPADLFIHGMVNSSNGGTCSSMPVLYAAVGRRLGYPIKLVLAKQHVFCRWDDGKERFNIEASGNGGVDYPPDEHYRTWPLTITDGEMRSGEFLRSLTPQEELATFLLQRASCLRAHRRTAEERACLAEALQLMPNSVTLQTALRSTLATGVGQGVANRKQDSRPGPRTAIPVNPMARIPLGDDNVSSGTAGRQSNQKR